LALLDADVIIEAFRLGIWDLLVDKASITVASTVVGEAKHYFDPVTGERKSIDLQPYISSGKVAVRCGDTAGMTQVRTTCRPYMELHIGEIESIAVVTETGLQFCTADHAAAKAMVLLDLGHLALSFEALLKRHGLSAKHGPMPHFSKAAMTRWLREGGILKVQTFGKKAR
jgi:hypothetical protein